MNRLPKLAALAAVITAMISTAVIAKPTVRETIEHYKVYGNSFREIRESMAQNGPGGYWAYTSWYVKWTSSCRVSAKVKITLPELADRSVLTSRQLETWDEMMLALIVHERGHASNGVNAANEIDRRNCKRADSRIKYWAQKDINFDRETNHGHLRGVTLPR